MKRSYYLNILTLFLGLITFNLQVSAQNTFRINYDIANFDLAGGVVETPAGNYLFSGTNATFLPLFGNLFEVDQAGNMVWAKGYAAGIATEFSDIKNISTGGYIVSGATSPGLMLMNVASGGGLNWANRYETTNGNSEGGARVIETSDGGFLSAGRVYSYDPTGPPTILDSANLYVVKTNSAGTLLWDKIIFVTTAFDNDHTINDMAEVADGYVFVGTLSDSNLDSDNGGSSSGVIFKTDFAGNLQWINRLGTIGSSQTANSAYTLSNGEVLISGNYDADLMLIRVNSAGTITWSFIYDAGGGFFPNTAEGFDAFETNDGKYAVLGTYIDFSAFPAFSIGSFLLKTEPSNANLIFQRSYLGGLSTILPEGIQVSDSGYTMGMMAQQITGFNYHLIKTDPTGNLLDPTCTPGVVSFANSGFSPSFVAITPNEYSGSTRTGFVPIISNLTPTKVVDCQTIICTPPANPTASATSTTICAGSSTTINGAGSGAGVVYEVYTTPTGGSSLGTTPLVVTPGATTTYYVEAVVTASSCPSAIRDPITITVVSITTSVAGPNQSVCATSATLAGNTPAAGTGLWTLISGAGTITTPASPTSGITGLGVGANVFQWTITNAPCTPSSTQVTITGVAAPTASNAGPNQTLCSTSATLGGNTPTVGSGTWTLISGAGTITTPGSPTTGVTGLGVGPNVFQWTITNAPCAPSTSQVTITNTGGPTTSVAGPNQTVCSTSATLAGNTATTGTGLWTLVSGAGTITTPASPTSGVTGLGVGPNVFQWTISNAPCTPSSTQVTITGVAPPTTSVAGPNQTICATSTTLAGNTPTTGTGLWTLISGAGTITTPGSPTSGVTGLGVGPNVFEWTISNSPCAPSSTQVTITNTGGPTTSVAGPNQTVCSTSATLAGNTATTGTGLWTLVSGAGTITTPGSPTSGVTGLGVGPNVFQWTISNAPCTPSSTQVTITGVAPPTVSNAGTNQTVCANSTTLAGNTATIGTGTWTLISGAGTITTPGSATSGVTGLGVGPNVFEWTINNPPCAPSTSQVTITYSLGPTVTASSTDTVICLGDVITLSGIGGSSYTWDNGAIDGIPFGPTTTTTYTVTGFDANLCSNTAQLTITVNPLPAINVTGTNSICNGDSTLLTASGGTSYVWNTSDTTTVINVTPSSTTTYTVTGTDANGCQNTGQITVTVSAPPSATISGSSTVCNGDVVNLTASGGGTYVWNTGDTTTIITVNPNSTTNYTLIATIGSCIDTTTFTVNVTPLPTVILTPSPDTTINLGQSANLNASGGTSYSWTPNSDLSCSTCANPTATPDITTVYCVSVTNSGCTDTACVTVIVEINCGEVFVPTAFSPNGDGSNDCLKVYNNCVESMLFRVYARWGEIVFESTDVDECWDGSFKGKDLNTAVFVYTLEATLINGEEVSQKGNVSLIR